MDANEHQQLGGQYGVQGFPTIKIFGSNKYKPEDYQGILPSELPVIERLGLQLCDQIADLG